MTFEESTNHLNRHPSISHLHSTVASVLSRSKLLLDNEREKEEEEKRAKERNDVDEENGHSKI